MKVIDLLNKIANGEEVPKIIKYEDQEWKYNPLNDYEGLRYGGCLLNQVTLDHLNDEVEIIEEPQEHKIPEKIEEEEIKISMAIGEQICANKINEILDYLEEENNERNI